VNEEWLIKGVAVVGGEPTDLHVKDGVIAAVGGGLAAPGATVLEADGLVALPGLVDLHTHLREPGREDAETVETGTRAAALGGYTAVHAMANTEPVNDSPEVTAYMLERAAQVRAAALMRCCQSMRKLRLRVLRWTVAQCWDLYMASFA